MNCLSGYEALPCKRLVIILPSPLWGEGRVRGSDRNPGATVSAAFTLTPDLSLKGEGDFFNLNAIEAEPHNENLYIA